MPLFEGFMGLKAFDFFILIKDFGASRVEI